MDEYLFSINNFNRPKILTGNDATYTLIVRLILLEPGTIQSHPEMGIGLVSRYRYSDTQNLEVLKNDINNQMSIYLPDLVTTDITINEGPKYIVIRITANNILYEIIFDKVTKTIKVL